MQNNTQQNGQQLNEILSSSPTRTTPTNIDLGIKPNGATTPTPNPNTNKRAKIKKEKNPRKQKPANTEKNVPNVDVWQSVRAIIFSLIIFCVAFMPLSFATDSNGQSALSILPIFGNGEILNIQKTCIDALINKIGLASLAEVATYTQLAVQYCFTALYIILIANVLFNLILIIFRLSFFRFIFKIISIFAGFAMILVSLTLLATVIGFFVYFIDEAIPLNQLGEVVLTSGIVFIFVEMIFSFILIGKQFRWYAKYY